MQKEIELQNFWKRVLPSLQSLPSISFLDPILPPELRSKEERSLNLLKDSKEEPKSELSISKVLGWESVSFSSQTFLNFNNIVLPNGEEPDRTCPPTSNHEESKMEIVQKIEWKKESFFQVVQIPPSPRPVASKTVTFSLKKGLHPLQCAQGSFGKERYLHPNPIVIVSSSLEGLSAVVKLSLVYEDGRKVPHSVATIKTPRGKQYWIEKMETKKMNIRFMWGESRSSLVTMPSFRILFSIDLKGTEESFSTQFHSSVFTIVK